MVTVLMAVISVIGFVGLSCMSVTKVEAATVKLNKKSIKIYQGKTYEIKISGVKSATWSKKGSAVSYKKNSKVKVTVKGVKAGTGYMYARVGKKKYSCKVTVLQAKLLSTSTNLTVGGSSIELKMNSGAKVTKWEVISNGKLVSLKKSTTKCIVTAKGVNSETTISKNKVVVRATSGGKRYEFSFFVYPKKVDTPVETETPKESEVPEETETPKETETEPSSETEEPIVVGGRVEFEGNFCELTSDLFASEKEFFEKQEGLPIGSIGGGSADQLVSGPVNGGKLSYTSDSDRYFLGSTTTSLFISKSKNTRFNLYIDKEDVNDFNYSVYIFKNVSGDYIYNISIVRLKAGSFKLLVELPDLNKVYLIQAEVPDGSNIQRREAYTKWVQNWVVENIKGQGLTDEQIFKKVCAYIWENLYRSQHVALVGEDLWYQAPNSGFTGMMSDGVKYDPSTSPKGGNCNAFDDLACIILSHCGYWCYEYRYDGANGLHSPYHTSIVVYGRDGTVYWLDPYLADYPLLTTTKDDDRFLDLDYLDCVYEMFMYGDVAKFRSENGFEFNSPMPDILKKVEGMID